MFSESFVDGIELEFNLQKKEDSLRKRSSRRWGSEEHRAEPGTFIMCSGPTSGPEAKALRSWG